VYLVALSRWHWTDDAWEGENVPVAAYRSREKAEAECRRLTEAARADVAREDVDHDHRSEFSERDWRYEVVELVLDHDPTGG
jgi:hypothetical protein